MANRHCHQKNTEGGDLTSDVEIGLIDLKNVSVNEDASNKLLPTLFERSANTWWNPKFDSEKLENQLQKCLLPQSCCRFRWALLYIVVLCIVWCIFFIAMKNAHWIAFFIGTLVLLIVVILALGFSYTKAFEGMILQLSVAIILLLCSANLLSYIYNDPDLSAVGMFTISIEILILLYTFFSLPLYICVGIGVLYSLIFELLSTLITGREMQPPAYIISRALLHFAIHVIGIHIFIMSQVRKRSTFLKVCQSVRLRQNLEVEKQLKHCMINSLMPPKVAEEIMKSRDHERDCEGNDDDKDERHSSQGPERGRMTFRHFHMSQMDNVSILFADIVGFTKMSSKKTAEHLVYLLSDLFGRFDKICVECNCEKISTLGDCYYCVSGCPEPRDDHAKCCVEMGLKMCVAIKQFDRDHNEEVNMRVGVHTGTVLCGLVGTRRFKFDVWSHDVTLANMMESEGKAGLVHISDYTYNFVKDDYEVEKGKSVKDIRTHKLLRECFDIKSQQFIVEHVDDDKDRTIDTWFITGQKSETSQSSAQNGTPAFSDSSAKCKDDMMLNETSSLPGRCSDVLSPLTEPLGAAVSEEHDEMAESRMSAVQLMGRRENSAHEETEGEAITNGTVVTHLLGSKKEEKEADNNLIKMISKQTENYLYHPAINHWTICFKSSKLEQKYHKHYNTSAGVASPTCASPQISSLFDMIVSLIFFLIISICCFLAFGTQWPWVIAFAVALTLELFVFALMLVNICMAKKGDGCLVKVWQFFSSWYPCHLFGGIIASLPSFAVYTTFLCDNFLYGPPCTDLFYCLLIIASFLHFCNFTMLSSWMKSCLAAVSCFIFLFLLGIGFCGEMPVKCSENSSECMAINISSTATPLFWNKSQNTLKYEIILDALLLLLLIFFLNRDTEISYRVSYHGDVEAVRDHQKMQTEEEQADWLLHNIVPEHVAEHLKQNNKYSKTHKDIGVIFAKIVNFEDFYDESFEGGKEYLRVLNELMGDFEELFDDPKYRNIEKIKTIGSCLMAASGLNPESGNEDPDAHLCALMDFSYELLHKLELFNKEIFNFNFEMSVGYNFGEVTAGVVGTTKLLYDIWGDTVNIASRMYSTGVHGRIQVTEDTYVRLKDYFDFERRGQVLVKGKGDMNVFLLAEKRRQGKAP